MTAPWNVVRGSVPKVKITYEHSMCQHCQDAPCMEACTSKAIYRRDDGIVPPEPSEALVASLVERDGGAVWMLEGPRWNLKVTVEADLEVLAALLARRREDRDA